MKLREHTQTGERERSPVQYIVRFNLSLISTMHVLMPCT